MQRPGRPLNSLSIAVLAVGWTLAFFLPVLRPGSALGCRDIPVFHLPLRTSLRWLAELGPPTWNPWLHGGQPVLSNPNYAAFYPPTWLCLIVAPDISLTLLAAGHFLFAFWGGWRLARRLGCGTAGAILAALGFSGSGAVLSLLGAFNMFVTFAWFPWILELAFAVAEPAAARSRRLRFALLLGLALGLQFLCGEPVVSLTAGLAIGAILLGAWRTWRRSLPAFGLAAVLALGVSAVQLVPTFGRLSDTVRAEGLVPSEATDWSMPPMRVAELFFPRLLGDPSRTEQGFFFSRGIHDRSLPYLFSLYPSLLLAVLGVAALMRGATPHRLAWAAMFFVSLFLALGRHNPLFPVLRSWLPILAVVRYPEKFAVLAVAALAFSGAASWEALLSGADGGGSTRRSTPLILALSVFVAALGIALALTFSPQVSAWLLATHAQPNMGSQDQVLAVAFLTRESWIGVGCAAVVAAILASVRLGAGSARRIAVLAASFTAFDLWHYGHLLVKPIPRQAYWEPPPLVRTIETPGDRIYVQPPRKGERDYFPRAGETELGVAYASLERLDPYSGLLWHLPYALHGDFDLMLTRSGREANALLAEDGRNRELGLRFLGAWNVGTVFVRKPAAMWRRDLALDPRSSPMGTLTNPYRLPRFRFAPQVAFHAGRLEAEAAARANGWRSAQREDCVRPDRPPGAARFANGVLVRRLTDRASRVDLTYRAPGGAAFVMASTYDPGWQARVDGRRTSVYPTAAGQMLVLLPEGEHRLRLRYSDPLVIFGGAVSLASLAVATILLLRRRPLAAASDPRAGVA